MKVTGIVIHQSACTSINGKGYDFFITKAGVVIPAAEPTNPGGRVHICLEGNFSSPPEEADISSSAEQFFVAAKLIAQLEGMFGFGPSALVPHSEQCPGVRFPWQKLVLSISDGYH